MHYLIEYGRDPLLSHLELTNYFENKKIPYRILEEHFPIVILDSDHLVPNTVINDLSGTIRIAKVLCQARRIDELEYALEQLEIYKGTSHKTEYCITNYHSAYLGFFMDWLKDYFKRIKVKARLRKDPTPTKLHKKENVLDFILFKTTIAETVAVTNPKLLKERDLGRPAVDYMKVISLRLARMLINIGMLHPGETMLDPFCGSGTILHEALLKGYHVIGCDNDTEAITQAKKNIAWVQKTYHTQTHVKLYQMNATSLSTVLRPNSVDAIITEPYLGPYLKRLPTLDEAMRTTRHLTNLYDKLFRELTIILKDNKHIVMIFPVFKTLENKTVRIHINQFTTAHHFTILATVPYQPPKSKIGREIVVLQKNQS